jgi:hypothetical protein
MVLFVDAVRRPQPARGLLLCFALRRPGAGGRMDGNLYVTMAPSSLPPAQRMFVEA